MMLDDTINDTGKEVTSLVNRLCRLNVSSPDCDTASIYEAISLIERIFYEMPMLRDFVDRLLGEESND